MLYLFFVLTYIFFSRLSWKKDESNHLENLKQNQTSIDCRPRESSESSYGSYILSVSETRTPLVCKNTNESCDISCHNLTYIIHEIKFPFKSHQKVVLNKISATFCKANLNAIIGPAASGKSSLLHALAGNINSDNANITGNVLYGGNAISLNSKPWERCPLVEKHDHYLRDLSIKESLLYISYLKTADLPNSNSKQEIENASNNIIELLKLTHCANLKAKYLTKGQIRLLSIAEEIIFCTRKCLLIDEPITDLNEKDTAILINTLRNLVNNNYNVVVTLDTPSPAVFKSIDTCLLLRKGSKIYLGKAENAVNYFTSAPFKVNL